MFSFLVFGSCCLFSWLGSVVSGSYPAVSKFSSSRQNSMVMGLLFLPVFCGHSSGYFVCSGFGVFDGGGFGLCGLGFLQDFFGYGAEVCGFADAAFVYHPMRASWFR